MRASVRISTRWCSLFSCFARPPQLIIIIVHAYSVAGAGGDDESQPSFPTWLGVGLLAAEFVGGWLWWKYSSAAGADKFQWMKFIVIGAVLLHLPAQFLPYGALALGWVDCDTGIRWAVHCAYMVILMIGLPTLSSTGPREVPKMRIPIVGMDGSTLAQSYHFFCCFLTASDQYLDNMTVSIAFACDWPLAPAMAVTMIAGLLLQAACAWVVTGNYRHALIALAGVAPEGVELMAANSDLEREYRRFAAYQGVSKFVTENCPQAYLAIKFAHDMRPSSTVWVSVAMSLILGVKACVNGLLHFFASDYTHVETDEH